MTLAIVDMFVIVRACCTGMDIPPNTTTVLIWVNGTIMSLAFGTSAYETVRKDEIQESIDLANIMQGNDIMEGNDCPTEGRERGRRRERDDSEQ